MWLLSVVTLILTLAPGSIRLARLPAVLRGGGGAGGGPGDPGSSPGSAPRSGDKTEIGGDTNNKHCRVLVSCSEDSKSNLSNL